MGSKLKIKCSGGVLARALRRQRGPRHASILPCRLVPALAGLSLAGLFVDRGGLDACIQSRLEQEAPEVRHENK